MAAFAFSATATTTAAAITTTTPFTYGVYLKAAAANSGKVHIGFNSSITTATAATDGYELSAGNEYFVTPDEANNNLINIYILASTGTQKVYAIGH